VISRVKQKVFGRGYSNWALASDLRAELHSCLDDVCTRARNNTRYKSECQRTSGIERASGVRELVCRARRDGMLQPRESSDICREPDIDFLDENILQ
jgi:hypothetical protein